MRDFSSRTFVLVAILVGVCMPTAAPDLYAQGVRVAAGQANEKTSEEQIRAALKKPIQISAVETPISDVLRQLGKTAGINVVLDRRSLEEVGLGGDTLVTRELEGVSLNSALRLILNELELTHLIRDEVLLITTKEVAETLLTTTVYEVGDLVFTKSPQHDLVHKPYSRLSASAADFDSLIDLITTTIEPDTWDEVGGPGSISALEYSDRYVLVVSQTLTIGEQIEELLEKLRAVKPHVDAHGEARREQAKGPKIVARIYPIIGDSTKIVGELAELLRETTGAKLWNEKEGTMLVGKANAVLVRHHVEVHKQITEVLEGLKAIEQPPGGWGHHAVPLVQPAGK